MGNDGALAGVHPQVVQERLGHANTGITLDTYRHVTGSLHDDAEATVAAPFADARWQAVCRRPTA